MTKQLDGSAIDETACTCVPAYMTGGQTYSLTCPIDRHRVLWLQQHWEFDDDGRVICGDGNESSDSEPSAESFRLGMDGQGRTTLIDS